MPSCVKEFSRRVDLANGKYWSIFWGAFARIMKFTYFAQVINFRKRAHGKIHSRKVDKNNRESTFVFFIVTSSIQQQKQKIYSPLIFCSLSFSNGLFNHALAKGADHIIIPIINQLSLRCTMTATWLLTSGIIQLFYWHLAIKVFSDLQMLNYVFVIANDF